ncbi:MAG: hypothetical protein AVDCRST_MAG70-518 [uncultured Thermomicrobiales bacterium]|uniref:Uncharacterized protein n=1 Tax=uncultured Thermomicrobiales bacterium TaxID=1645740 RepID=A0A6J4UEA7_9BACT|nr:MAG: hypothetical protein AVDCRST_MAG70-518 [uncultured Thermomicrobiales bacterium]
MPPAFGVGDASWARTDGAPTTERAPRDAVETPSAAARATTSRRFSRPVMTSRKSRSNAWESLPETIEDISCTHAPRDPVRRGDDDAGDERSSPGAEKPGTERQYSAGTGDAGGGRSGWQLGSRQTRNGRQVCRGRAWRFQVEVRVANAAVEAACRTPQPDGRFDVDNGRPTTCPDHRRRPMGRVRETTPLRGVVIEPMEGLRCFDRGRVINGAAGTAVRGTTRARTASRSPGSPRPGNHYPVCEPTS